MGRKITFRVPRADFEQTEGRRPVNVVLGVSGGGSPYGSSTYKRRRLCPFEDALVTVVGMRSDQPNDALDIGTMVHAALEAYYRVLARAHAAEPPRGYKALVDYLREPVQEAANAALDVIEPFRTEPGYAADYQITLQTVSGYLERWETDYYRVLAVEETLIYEEVLDEPVRLSHDGEEIMVDRFAYSARLDAVVQDMNPGKGGVYALEHKTAKFINEDLVHGYQQDMQMLGQYWLMQRCLDLDALPGPLAGVVVNIASKQPKPQFDRVEVCPSAYHLHAFEDSTRRWSIMNRLFAWAGYPKALGSCAGALRGYSRCAYYDLCHAYPEKTIGDWLREPAPVGFHKEEGLRE